MSDGEVLPAVCRGVVWRSVGEDAVVFTGSGDVVHGLTERGRLVLAACQAGSTVEDVAAQQSWHRSEVIAVVAELAALHLVDPTAATALNGSSSVESSRRAMLQRSAVIGGGVVIASVAAPMVAAHATGDLSNNPSANGYVYPTSAQYRGQYYYPVGTQVSGLTPGDVITGFEFSQTLYQKYDYGYTTVTFAVIDGAGALPYGFGSAPAVDGVNGVTEDVAFSPSTTATASGFAHPVPLSGEVIIAAYIPVGPTQRYFDQVYTGDNSDVLYFYNGQTSQDSSLVFTVYGYTPTNSTTKSVHGDRSESARSRDESRAHPAITVLSRQEPLGLPLPPGVPRPGQLDPAKLRRSRRRPG